MPYQCLFSGESGWMKHTDDSSYHGTDLLTPSLPPSLPGPQCCFFVLISLLFLGLVYVISSNLGGLAELYKLVCPTR